MIPDLNGVIGPLKGRFGLLQKFRFRVAVEGNEKSDAHLRPHLRRRSRIPGKGIESGMIYTFEQDVAKKIKFRYKSLELAWIGDFNPVMMRMVENYGLRPEAQNAHDLPLLVRPHQRIQTGAAG